MSVGVEDIHLENELRKSQDTLGRFLIYLYLFRFFCCWRRNGIFRFGLCISRVCHCGILECSHCTSSFSWPVTCYFIYIKPPFLILAMHTLCPHIFSPEDVSHMVPKRVWIKSSPPLDFILNVDSNRLRQCCRYINSLWYTFNIWMATLLCMMFYNANHHLKLILQVILQICIAHTWPRSSST